MSLAEAPAPSLPRRLWTYQAERFPLARTSALVLAFSAASVSASAALAERPLPGLSAFAVAFLATWAFFFQLRVLDEIKDGEDDRRYRPERPIPRGLVTLRLVVGLGLATVPLVVLAAWGLDPRLLLVLALVWAWMALMAVEFFAPAWLKARPVAYLVSHMAVMPLIDGFVTACEWLPARAGPPAGLGVFLALSFVNGLVLEIGRKLWSPEREREGVETYSRLWGPRRAALIWVAVLNLALALVLAMGNLLGAPLLVVLAAVPAAAWAGRAGLIYARAPTPAAAARVDEAAGLWVLVAYAACGLLPRLGTW